MQSEDTNNQSGDDEDPTLALIAVVGVLTVFVAVNTEISIIQAVVAGLTVLLLGTGAVFWLRKHGEATVLSFFAPIRLILVTKWANVRYWWNNPWRRPLPDVGRAWLSARQEQAWKLGRTVSTTIRTHPSTPFEQPDDQSSEKKQLEVPDDE